VVDAYVVWPRIAPWFQDEETALGGGGHKTEFDPFSALFKAGEVFPVVHSLWRSLKRKGAAHGLRLFFLKF
jgi:hypothetical protein